MLASRLLLTSLLLPSLSILSNPLISQLPAARHTPMAALDESHLHAALDAYDAGDATKAEPILRDLSTRYPSSYEAHEALGSLYAESGDLAQALPLLKQAAALAPKQPLAHANLGATYLKLGRLPEAVHELQRAAALDPGNATTQAALGDALMTSRQPAAAAAAYTLAARTSPTNPTLNYNLALALFDSGSPAKSAEVLDHIPAAARTDAIDALAGDAAERSGNFQLALSHFQAAAQRSPTDSNLYALVLELLRHWNWSEATRVANFASGLFPASAHFPLAAGIAYYADNQYPKAIETFSSLLAADPNNAAVADLLGRSCSLLPDGQNPGCAAIYDYAERHPGNPATMTYAAVAILHGPRSQLDLTRARSLLEAAIRAKPDDAEALLQLGILEQSEEHWSASAADLEHSIALRPASAEAHYRLSRAYAHLNRRAEATEQVALNQTYSQQAKDSLNKRMAEVMKFVLEPK